MAKKTNDKKITVQNQIPTDFVGTDAEKAMAKKFCSIPKGQFARFGYMTKVPLAARFANAGYVILCKTETTARTGVYYPNINGVVLKDGGSSKENNYEWVVPNYIKRNTKTGKNYAVIAPISKGNNIKKTYHLIKPDTPGMTQISYEDVLNYTTPSYANKRGTKRHVIDVSLENIQYIK